MEEKIDLSKTSIFIGDNKFIINLEPFGEIFKSLEASGNRTDYPITTLTFYNGKPCIIFNGTPGESLSTQLLKNGFAIEKDDFDQRYGKMAIIIKTAEIIKNISLFEFEE